MVWFLLRSYCSCLGLSLQILSGDLLGWSQVFLFTVFTVWYFYLLCFPQFSSTHLLFSVAFQLLFILGLLTTNNFSPVTCFNEYLQAEMTLKQLENLSPPIMKQVLPLVEQLPPLYMDLVKGREEFTPKPEETRRLVCEVSNCLHCKLIFIFYSWYIFLC